MHQFSAQKIKRSAVQCLARKMATYYVCTGLTYFSSYCHQHHHQNNIIVIIVSLHKITSKQHRNYSLQHRCGTSLNQSNSRPWTVHLLLVQVHHSKLVSVLLG